MILDVALGIVLGVALLIAGFFVLAWFVNWWREHWEAALLIGIPLALMCYASVIDNSAGIGMSGILLIVGILLALWRGHQKEAAYREQVDANIKIKEAREWRAGGDP